jgi:outer membrane protein assembly factor BamB
VISNKTAGGNPSLFALDAEEGNEIWNVDLGDIAVFGAITVVNDVIYFGDMDGVVHVRSSSDGSVIWADPHVPATDNAQRDAEAIAAGISVVNGTIYVPFGGQAFPTSYFTSANPAVLGGGVVAYHVP